MEFRQFERVRLLVNEALDHLAKFGRQDELALIPVFMDAAEALQARSNNRSGTILLINATNRRIARAEKQTISWIIGDQNVNTDEMSHLVRLRLICAEILNLLNDGLEEIRRAQR